MGMIDIKSLGGNLSPFDIVGCEVERLEFDHFNGLAFFKLPKSVVVEHKSVIVMAIISDVRTDYPGTYAYVRAGALYFETSRDSIYTNGENGLRFEIYGSQGISKADPGTEYAGISYSNGLVGFGHINDRIDTATAFVIYRK